MYRADKEFYSKKIDKMISNVIDDYTDEPYYEFFDKGISIESLIREENRNNPVEKSFLEALKEFNIKLDVPMFAHLKDRNDPFDLLNVFLLKEYVVILSYYSIGSVVDTASIYKLNDPKGYFKEEPLDVEPESIDILFERKRDEESKLISVK